MTIDEANEDENVKGIFTIEQIGQRASSKYAAGQIIEQSPERGKTVKGNRVISVFVSSGAKTEKMPNLVNKEYRDATLQLTNLDLNLVINDPVEEYSSITKGYVIRTIPEFGETLQEGDSVTLVVSKGEQPKPVTVLSFIGIDIEIVRQQVTQTGLVVGEVTQRASDVPREMHELTQLCLKNRFLEAGALQLKLHELIRALFCEVNPIPVKAAMELLGLCSGELRLPLCRISERHLEQLSHALEPFRPVV